MSSIIEKLKNLPQAPGVYFFYGGEKELLYIGKATNLRSRVQSYFRGVTPNLIRNPEMLKQVQHDKNNIVEVQGRSEWIGLMVAQVADIAFQETDSVLEALILESNLIKKHQPKYNTLEKDDKSFSYFAVTKEEFPRVIIVRKTDFKKYVIPNLFRDLDRKGEMLKPVQHDNTEKVKAKKIKPEKLAAIYGPYTSKMQMQIALKIIRRIFPFHALKQKTEKGCLDFQLGVCPGPYSGKISNDDYKKNIRGIRMILEGRKGSLIRMLNKEMESAAKKEEFEKAADIRNKIYALQHIRDVALITRDFEEVEINQKNISEAEFFRIEAYDISNISGYHAVGSMVVFENGKANKNQYRKFKIKTIEGSNDVGMMKEVLTRRFNNDWKMPNLILLDGGRGHVNMAEKILLEDLGLSVAIVGVAKGPTRKKLDLQFTKKQSFNIDDASKVDKTLKDENLLKSIMDEAHRFAITYHRKVRSRNIIK